MSHFIYSPKGFWARIKITLRVFSKHPWIFIFLPFIGITLGRLAVAGLAIGTRRIEFLTERGDSFIYILFPNLKVQIVVLIGTFIITAVLASFTLLAPLKVMLQLDAGRKTSFFSSIQYGFTKIGRYVAYLWNIFKYVYLVPFIAAILVIAAQIYVNGNKVLPFGSETAYFIVQYGGLGVLLLTLFYSIWRGMRAIFGMYFIVDEDLSAKDALKQSIALSHNHWWKIFGNFLGVLLLIGMILEAISYGLYKLFLIWHAPLDGWQIDIINRSASYSDKLSVLGFSGGFTQIALTGTASALVMIFFMLLLRTIQKTDEQAK